MDRKGRDLDGDFLELVVAFVSLGLLLLFRFFNLESFKFLVVLFVGLGDFNFSFGSFLSIDGRCTN